MSGRPHAVCPQTMSAMDLTGSGLASCLEGDCAVWTRYGCGLSSNITEHAGAVHAYDEAERIAANKAAGKEPF